MQKPPKFTEIRMGNLVFITKDKMLVGYDATAQRFDKALAVVADDSRFVMAMSTCGGVLVRNLDPQAEIPIAMAHVPSAERARKLMPGATHAHIRDYLRSPQSRMQIKQIVSDLARVLPEAAEEMVASLFSPIFGSDLLVKHVVEAMGTNLEVRLFGGILSGQQRVPDIVTAMETEFRQADIANIVIEQSVLDLNRLDMIAMIAPFAEDSRDLVRPWRKFKTEDCAVIRLNANFDG
jgi:hypothetical protein